jgi:hypothetical protein
MQGFRALLDREGADYSIEKIAAKTGKAASFIAKRLKLLDLTQPAADAFTAGHIGVEHALLIAKLAPEMQEKALSHCFDGYFAANDSERSLVPASRLQAWIEQNVYLSLKSVPRGLGRAMPDAKMPMKSATNGFEIPKSRKGYEPAEVLLVVPIRSIRPSANVPRQLK